ncbi:MAG: histidine--tRNA ligase [Gammaproteobacteria bacterium]|nr:MAG: histidine--tRNA ligase [Gammaproteobacteria bacterium]|tara:strand:+ start:2502 stop:3758 length:1257 start_codon:yes stop_codon:yes gene_type:complete
MKNFTKLRGMLDIDPSLSSKYSFIESNFNKISKSYGYKEVRFPIIEATDLFRRTVGNETDIVNKEMFTFNSKSGKSMTLRPEGTAGCMRMAIEEGLVDAGQQKLSYKGPMFRYERPQKGRSRQFQQMSLEAYGFKDSQIDIEMIEISYKFFKELSLDKDIFLEVNSIGSQEDQKNYSLELKNFFSKYKKDLDEDSLKRLEKNPLRILDSKNKDLLKLIDNAPKINEFISDDSKKTFKEIREAITGLNIKFTENPLLVRGLDYYNDLVFEWKSKSIGSQDTICGGGRYDSLSKMIGGRDIKATGFSIGLDRLSLIVEDAKIPYQKTLLLVSLEESFFLSGLKLANSLRDNLDNFSIQFSGKETNLKSILKKASKRNIDFMVIIGKRELEENSYTLKKLLKNEEIKLDNFDLLISNLKDN